MGGGFQPISASRTVEAKTRFELDVSEPSRYFLIWITELPPSLKAHVNEVRAR